MESAFGVVGLGAFGHRYLRGLNQVPGARVIWACDPDPDARDRAHAAFPDLRIADDAQELMEMDELDAVILVTPESTRRDLVVGFLAETVDVVVEKPLSTTIDDLQDIQQAADASDAHLYPAHLLRFDRRYAQVHQRLDQIGQIRSIHAWRNFDRSLFRVYSRTHSFIENAIHDLDLMIWYLGEETAQVHGFVRNTLGLDHPDINWGVLEFPSGALGVLQSNWLLPEQTPEDLHWNVGMSLFGDGGWLEVRSDSTGLAANLDERGLLLLDQSAWFTVADEPRGAFGAMLRHIVACVRRETSWVGTTLGEAASATSLALALVEDANARSLRT